MTQYDGFEEKFAEALHTEEMPSADFTARVMAQVAKTPQVKAGFSRRTWKIVLTAAACFAVAAIAVPMVFFGTMRAGSAAPAASDCAAPAAAEDCAEEEIANVFTAPADSPTGSIVSANGEAKSQSDVDSGASPQEEEISLSNAELCTKAREIAEEIGAEGDGSRYYLTQQQAALLHEAMPELELPTGGFVLVLEG